MNSHDALHHGKRAANKGGRSVWQICNRTKLTMLATVDMFELQRVICQKSPILNYSTCIWQLLWGWRRWSFAEIFSMRTQSPWVIVWHCLHDPTFSHFSRTRLVTDRQTDKRRQDIPLPCMVQKVNSLATVFTAHFHISQLHTAALIFLCSQSSAFYIPYVKFNACMIFKQTVCTIFKPSFNHNILHIDSSYSLRCWSC